MAKKGGKGARKSGGGGKAKKGRKSAARAGKSSKGKKPMARKAAGGKSKAKKSTRAGSAKKSAGRAKKSTIRASSSSKTKAKKPKKLSSGRKADRGGQASVRITESVTQFISTPQGVVADTIETVSTFPPETQERSVQTTDDIAAEGQRPSLSSEEELEDEDEFGEMGEGGGSMSDMEEPMSNENGNE